ncbi:MULTISPECIES: hypothetical protein [Acidobacterium]|nr:MULTISPECIES: hypothetical protein [Acidobacterium]
MKLIVRALVLGIAVSGLAASALSAHMGVSSAKVNANEAKLAGNQVVGFMPAPVCLPGTCGLSSSR